MGEVRVGRVRLLPAFGSCSFKLTTAGLHACQSHLPVHPRWSPRSRPQTQSCEEMGVSRKAERTSDLLRSGEQLSYGRVCKRTLFFFFERSLIVLFFRFVFFLKYHTVPPLSI